MRLRRYQQMKNSGCESQGRRGGRRIEEGMQEKRVESRDEGREEKEQKSERKLERGNRYNNRRMFLSQNNNSEEKEILNRLKIIKFLL